jgi:hypothetical protein
MGKGTSQQTGTTSYVEGSIVWAGLGQSDDMIQRFFIPDGLRLRKGRRLTGELVKDAVVVCDHRLSIVSQKQHLPRSHTFVIA